MDFELDDEQRGGSPKCSINTTRRRDGLAADIRRVDCQLVLADVEHMPLLDGLDLGGATVLDVGGAAYREAVAAAKPLVPHWEVNGADPVLMIFTSGTGGDPKALRFANAMAVMRGASLVDRFELTSDDVCYLSMPLSTPTGWRQAGRWRSRAAPPWCPRSSRRRGSCRTSAGIAPRT